MGVLSFASMTEAWDQDDFTRFEQMFTIGNPDECWVWEGPYGGTANKGLIYPIFSCYMSEKETSTTIIASRLVYCYLRGDIEEPEGKLVRFFRQCEEQMCVNPDHYDIRFHKRHSKNLPGRYKPKKKKRASKTHCRNGHNINRAAAKTPSGACRQCRQEENKRRSEKKRAWHEERRENWAKYAEEYLQRY